MFRSFKVDGWCFKRYSTFRWSFARTARLSGPYSYADASSQHQKNDPVGLCRNATTIPTFPKLSGVPQNVVHVPETIGIKHHDGRLIFRGVLRRRGQKRWSDLGIRPKNDFGDGNSHNPGDIRVVIWA